MSDTFDGFEALDLDDGHRFLIGQLPNAMRPDPAGFDALWRIHPDDYHYTGRTNTALPVPSDLEPFRAWARRTIDERLNGLLLNWYDGELGHYLGPHHDSVKEMIRGAPIVTMSFGEGRTFRLTHPGRKLTRDFPADSGTVFVMPYDTNLAWKHSVPKFARHRGRRISLTLRAFTGSTE